MEDKVLLNTREVAHFLDVNEKVVYSLISDKGLPATKVTGKWLFPKQQVLQWIENETLNYPKSLRSLPPHHDLLIISGSSDILLEKAIAFYNRTFQEHIAVFDNGGCEGGLRALAQGRCHIASSHLLQGDEQEYKFDYAFQELKGDPPAVVNFCRREQGLVVAGENPKGISRVSDFGRKGIRIANHPRGTCTRLLLDWELQKAGIRGEDIAGYDREFSGDLEVGLEVLTGRADAALGTRTVATLLNLDFIPVRWERYDLIMSRERFFQEGVQLFLGLLHEQPFRDLVDGLEGYELDLCGKIVFPQKSPKGR